MQTPEPDSSSADDSIHARAAPTQPIWHRPFPFGHMFRRGAQRFESPLDQHDAAWQLDLQGFPSPRSAERPRTARAEAWFRTKERPTPSRRRLLPRRMRLRLGRLAHLRDARCERCQPCAASAWPACPWRTLEPRLVAFPSRSESHSRSVRPSPASRDRGDVPSKASDANGHDCPLNVVSCRSRRVNYCNACNPRPIALRRTPALSKSGPATMTRTCPLREQIVSVE